MRPLYIHSGVNRPDLLSLLDEEGALGMVNIQVVREPRLQWAFQRYAGVPLFLDSGFRRKLDVSSYVRLIERYGQRFRWIASLDHLFDQQASDDNYRQIVSQLCDAELRSKILWIYQGGKLGDLEARARDHRLVGIGGCVLRMLRDGVPATLAWLMRIGEVLVGAGAKAHVFGMGNKRMLSGLCEQPWLASLDSSKWLIAYRAHAVLLPSGECIRATELSRRECAARNLRVIEGWLRPSSQGTESSPFPRRSTSLF
jgi:hypothetical protein